jgi:hypothetical protein
MDDGIQFSPIFPSHGSFHQCDYSRHYLACSGGTGSGLGSWQAFFSLDMVSADAANFYSLEGVLVTKTIARIRWEHVSMVLNECSPSRKSISHRPMPTTVSMANDCTIVRHFIALFYIYPASDSREGVQENDICCRQWSQSKVSSGL